MSGSTGEGELSPQLLIEAYASGLFPMARSRAGSIAWYSPDPRAILPLEEARFSRSVKQHVRRGTFAVTFDRAFERVVRACAEPRPYSEETWISEPIIAAVVELHRLGLAHSVEAWLPGQASAEPTLAGGLYGVALGRAFFGESMFSRATDASKVSLFHLVEHLKQRAFTLLDVQFTSEHMQQFGVIEVPRTEYLRRLHEALDEAELRRF